ncbi:MAG: preprotein translocase subunit SecA [Dehalococcoidia bacterium]
MLNLFSRIIGDSNEKAVNKLRSTIDEVNELEPEFLRLTDEELRAVTDELRQRVQEGGENVDDLLPEAFAAVREAARRTLGMRHFDVQIIGGIVLHQGKIAEMKTGEGKTLVATLPTYLNALTGKGVHVVTVNDYLAKRDASWMGAVYHALGMTVGCLQNSGSSIYDPDLEQPDEAGADGSASFAAVAGENMRVCARQEAYAADIVYGTNNEFGFDYLRDNMVDEISRKVQRGLYYAVVDEVDNILIDEARTPLIISGPARESGQEYRRYAQIARQLVRDEDFEIDEKQKSISLTPEGIEKLERTLRVDNMYDPEHQALSHFVENAIRGEHIYQRDREYVVRNGEVIIVDEFTGRLMEGRRYSDGLHQALEAKEGVEIRRETVTYATITLQNYFRMYDKLSGMTGTAVTEAEEFFKIYKLEVVEIPTNQDMVREDRGDLIFMTENAKWEAVAAHIADLHEQGRPVLVGTTSIEKSEHLAGLLRQRRIPHHVLNAKQHEQEATIVAQAGRPGAVTVATNMAGRGTDIILGGNPDILQIPRDEWQREHDRVVEAGGLFVLGTERHESRRIDNQLRGRAGRQGDPGATQFFVSTEDDLIKRFGGDRIRGAMNLFRWEEGVPIENKMVSRSVESAQSKVEGYHFEIRKHLVDYDDVVNTQRDIIYKLRNQGLSGEELRPAIMGYATRELQSIVAEHVQGDIENWNIEGLQRDLNQIFPIQEILTDPDEIADMNAEEVEETVLEYAEELYDRREGEFGEEMMRTLERAIMLRTIDSQWVEHLTAIDNMRQGIGLQAAGQRDPLIQYKRQAFDMFSGLVARIETDVARTIFRVAMANQPPPGQQQARAVKPDVPDAVAAGNGQAPVNPAAARAAAALASKGTVMGSVNRGHGAQVAGNKKVGRNEPCPCGSGKKYKRCHGAA